MYWTVVIIFPWNGSFYQGLRVLSIGLYGAIVMGIVFGLCIAASNPDFSNIRHDILVIVVRFYILMMDVCYFFGRKYDICYLFLSIVVKHYSELTKSFNNSAYLTINDVILFYIAFSII